MKENRCRTCNKKLPVPAWKYCNGCETDAKFEKAEVVTIDPGETLEQKELRALKRVYMAQANTIDNYRSFFNYFGEDLKPFIDEWAKQQ